MKLSEQRLNAALYRIECGRKQHNDDAGYVAMAYRQLQRENQKWRKLINKYRLGILKVEDDGSIDLDALLADTQEE